MCLNDSQLNSVNRILHALSQPYAVPKICLLQGPPGTGKSFVIVSLVESILAQASCLSVVSVCCAQSTEDNISMFCLYSRTASCKLYV